MKTPDVTSEAKAPASIHIPADALAAVGAHARAEAPRECCGLLVGRVEAPAQDAKPVVRVWRAVATRNVADEPTRRYLIDPAEHFQLLRATRRSGDAIVGVYHSHPRSRPEPSPTDRAEALPNILYLIASPHRDDEGRATRAWWLVDGNFLEIPLVLSS